MTTLTLKNVHSLDKALLVEWTIASSDYFGITGGIIKYINETTKTANQITLTDAELEGEIYTIKNLTNGNKYSVSLSYISGSYNGTPVAAVSNGQSGIPCTVPVAPSFSITQTKGAANTTANLLIKMGSDNGSRITKMILSIYNLTNSTFLDDVIITATPGAASNSTNISDSEYAAKTFTKSFTSQFLNNNVYILHLTSVNTSGHSLISNSVELNCTTKPSKPLPFTITNLVAQPSLTITDPQAKNASHIKIIGFGTGEPLTKPLTDFKLNTNGSIYYIFSAGECTAPGLARTVKLQYVSAETESSVESDGVYCVYGVPPEMATISSAPVSIQAQSPPDGTYKVKFEVPDLVQNTIYASETSWSVKMFLNNVNFDTSIGSFASAQSVRTADSNFVSLKGGDLIRFEYVASTPVLAAHLELLPSNTPRVLSSKQYTHSYVVPAAPNVPSIKTVSAFFVPAVTGGSAEQHGVLLDLLPSSFLEYNKPTSYEYQIRKSNGTVCNASDTTDAVSTISAGLNVLTGAVFTSGASLQLRVRGKNIKSTPAEGQWSDWSLFVALGSPPVIQSTTLSASAVSKTLADKNFKVNLSWSAASSVANSTFLGWSLQKVDNGTTTTLVTDSNVLNYVDSFVNTESRTVSYYLSAKSKDNNGVINMSKTTAAAVTVGDNPSISLPQVVSMADGDHVIFKVKHNSVGLLTGLTLVCVPAVESPENTNPVISVPPVAADSDGFSSYDVNLAFRLGPEKSFLMIASNGFGSSILNNNM